MNDSLSPDYDHYSVNDFVLDDSFRDWVFRPSEESMAFWNTFLRQNPHKLTIINEASSILLHLRVKQDDLLATSRTRIWQQLSTAYDGRSATRPKQSPISFLQRVAAYPLQSWPIAASLAGLLLVAGGVWAWQHTWHRRDIHSGFGEVLTTTLPDGSRVRINGNTTLTYWTDWDPTKQRDVWIEGEAFFEVAKKSTPTGRLKFITHTPNLDISVVGTQFNVNTRRGNTFVLLKEGKVELSKPNDRQARVVLMNPGDLATAQAGIEQVDIQPGKPQLLTAWTRQQFAFNNTPLRDIAQQLADTWGVSLIFEDNDLANRRFTGNLSSQDLETLIATLSATFDLQADRDGNHIYLHRQAGPDQ